MIPPDTAITSAVDGNNSPIPNGGTTQSNKIAFTIQGRDNAVVAGFQCSLDNSQASVCNSSNPIIFDNLQQGTHIFQARAVGAVGNADPSPAVFNWNIIASTITSNDNHLIATTAPAQQQQQQKPLTANVIPIPHSTLNNINNNQQHVQQKPLSSNLTTALAPRLVSAQTTPGTPIEEEWVDPDYGKKIGHVIFNKVIIECEDNTDNSCVTSLWSGPGLKSIHLYATPLKSGNICCVEPPDYNTDIVQNCLANPNNAENCDWGKITPTSYSTLPSGERLVVAKRDFPKDPQDIGESFISVVLTTDGTTLKGRVIYQTCSSNTCVGTSDDFKPLQLAKRTPSHHASSVSVFSHLINDDGGKASFINHDFAIFWTQTVCNPGAPACETISPPEDETIPPLNNTNLGLNIINPFTLPHIT